MTSASGTELSEEALLDLRRRLCTWYAVEKRDLPWRRTRDPYAIWISESMLQQTRVETVIDYYTRFLARFPGIAELAAAEEEDVVALWSGLGYYRRARALFRAARAIVAEHGGTFPRTRDEVLALAGVGPYTAGAVLSIAFGASEPLVDGNVARVFARLLGLELAHGSSALQKTAWELARRAIPPATAPADELAPGQWNQALMELGATICTPRSPRCLLCPLQERCVARRAGREESLPHPAQKKPTVDVRLEILVVRRGSDVLFVRRPSGGRMANMWELPTRELPDEDGQLHALWPPALPPGLDPTEAELLDRVSHGITHHRIRATVRSGRLRTAGRVAEPVGRPRYVPDPLEPAVAHELRWGAPDELHELALTGLSRKVLKRVLEAADGAAPTD